MESLSINAMELITQNYQKKWLYLKKYLLKKVLPLEK